MRIRAKLTVLSLLLACACGRAQDVPVSEYQVKAAFIFNFAKFVEWPATAFPDSKAPLRIGVLGDNPFGDKLANFLRDKTLNDRPVVAQECKTIDDAKKCQVVFVSASETKRMPQVLADLARAGVLTVSDADMFIESGGIINFFREGNKFRFEISDQNARTAGLRIGSKLLELSKKRSAS